MSENKDEFWIKIGLIFILGCAVGVMCQFPWESFKAYEFKKDLQYNTINYNINKLNKNIERLENSINSLSKRIYLIEQYFCLSEVTEKDIKMLIDNYKIENKKECVFLE